MKCHLHRICASIWDLRTVCPGSILVARKNEPAALSDEEEACAVIHGTEIATGFPDASCSDVGRWKPARDYASVLLELIAGDTGAIGPAIVQVPLFLNLDAVANTQGHLFWPVLHPREFSHCNPGSHDSHTGRIGI